MNGMSTIQRSGRSTAARLWFDTNEEWRHGTMTPGATRANLRRLCAVATQKGWPSTPKAHDDPSIGPKRRNFLVPSHHLRQLSYVFSLTLT